MSIAIASFIPHTFENRFQFQFFHLSTPIHDLYRPLFVFSIFFQGPFFFPNKRWWSSTGCPKTHPRRLRPLVHLMPVRRDLADLPRQAAKTNFVPAGFSTHLFNGGFLGPKFA